MTLDELISVVPYGRSRNALKFFAKRLGIGAMPLEAATQSIREATFVPDGESALTLATYRSLALKVLAHELGITRNPPAASSERRAEEALWREAFITMLRDSMGNVDAAALVADRSVDAWRKRR